MPAPTPLIVHERLGTWARQFRPRVASWGARLFETRSADDLEAPLREAVFPIVVLDLGARPQPGLDDLARALEWAPTALAVVLDPAALPGVPLLARQIGALEVLSGATPPPVLLTLIGRWLPLARSRADADGWSLASTVAEDPWSGLLEPDPAP